MRFYEKPPVDEIESMRNRVLLHKSRRARINSTTKVKAPALAPRALAPPKRVYSRSLLFMAMMFLFVGSFCPMGLAFSVLVTKKYALRPNPLFAKRRKRSGGAAKAQALQQQLQEKMANLPSSKLDFKTPPKPPMPTGELDRQQAAQDQQAELTVAQQMVQAQRASVEMLTLVNDRIQEQLHPQELWEQLSNQGFAVVDQFLANATIVSQLQTESAKLYANNSMTADLTNLASGEYLLTIQGGEDQYPTCPRMVELVVALTSKVSAKWNEQLSRGDNDKDFTIIPRLDERSCMAQLRTYDAKVWAASQKLLLGQGDDDGGTKTNTTTNVDLPYLTVVQREHDATQTEDLRKISLCYFLDNHDTNGGGLVFANHATTSTATTIAAQADRLVLWRSDVTRYRRQHATATTTTTQGQETSSSCLELHYIQQT